MARGASRLSPPRLGRQPAGEGRLDTVGSSAQDRMPSVTADDVGDLRRVGQDVSPAEGGRHLGRVHDVPKRGSAHRRRGDGPGVAAGFTFRPKRFCQKAMAILLRRFPCCQTLSIYVIRQHVSVYHGRPQLWVPTIGEFPRGC